MDCPVDGTTLSITDRQGIEIDFCPKCRGVWLDRGELDKLIDRSAQWESRQSREGGVFERDDDDDRGGRYPRDRRRRRGFLGDLFEFGD